MGHSVACSKCDWTICDKYLVCLTLSWMESKIEHSGWGGGLITPATSTTQDFA